jgi:PIN domain nuclease of toxin-antitoxin system
VKYLLDTHVWIWSQETPERLGGDTRRRLADVDEERLVSPVSTLEIARLLDLGLLHLKHAFAEWRTQSLAHLHAVLIPLTHEIAAEAYNLPAKFHKDPIDRVLVATARIERLILVTADDLILRYPHVKTLRATA